MSVASRGLQLYTMSILPEEDITGFVVRQSFERSQGRTLIKVNNTAMATRRPGWAFPSGLSGLADVFSDALPDIDGVIDGHTRFPLYARFLSPSDANDLREHHKGNAMKGVAAHVGMVSRASRSRMAMCPECMRADMRENGYAIWHRLHLMPGILACPLQERLLLTFCEACEAGHRRVRTNWRPTIRCACGGSLRAVTRLDTKESEAAIAVAGMADRILKGTIGSDLSASAIAEALGHHFGGLGRNAHERFRDALSESLGVREVARLGFGALTLRRLVGSSIASGPVRSPVQNLAAIHAVFRGLDGFAAVLSDIRDSAQFAFVPLTAVESQVAKRRKSRRRKGSKYHAWVDGLSGEQKASLKIASRKWLLKLMKGHPGICRSDLKSHTGSDSALRYLRNIDLKWYDDILPAMDRRRQRVAQELALIHEIERLEEHIQQRYQLSLRERPMQRITKTYLLTGAPCESASNLVMKSVEIVSAIKACAETPAMRLNRLTEMVCREVRSKCPGHPYGDEKTYICLASKSRARRISGAKKWLSQNAN